LVAGSTLLSVVLAGVALGWLGVAVVVVVLFLLVVAEVWREAASATKRLTSIEAAFELAKREAMVVPGLRGRIEELQAAVAALEEEKRQPRAGLEETLEALTIHLARMDLVLKHRAMSSQVPAVPIMRAEINEDGAAELNGVAEAGIDLIRDEPLVAVKGDGDCGLDVSESVRIDGSQIRARFELAALPSDLADAIERQGSFNPQGYTLRLAGLCIDEYKAIGDADLAGMGTSLKGAMDALARTLVGRVPLGTANSES